MAPGTWKKIGNFFKKVWDGAKKVVKKVAPIAKTALPFLAPLIPGGAMIAPAISTGLGIAEKFADGDVGGGIKDIGTNITKIKDHPFGKKYIRGGIFGSPANTNNPIMQGLAKTRLAYEGKPTVGIDSPRIKLKL